MEQEDALDEHDVRRRHELGAAEPPMGDEAVTRRPDGPASAQRLEIADEEVEVERLGDVEVQPIALDGRHAAAVPVVGVERQAAAHHGVERVHDGGRERRLTAAAAAGDTDEIGSAEGHGRPQDAARWRPAARPEGRTCSNAASMDVKRNCRSSARSFRSAPPIPT